MREELTNLRRFYGDHVPTLLEARHEYAVLCPLVDRPDGLHLLFEVRSAGVSQSGETCFPGGQMEPGETPAEPGEVCFPGGRMEAGETPEQCALRETEEELSIPRAEIRLLGQGDFICNQRGFLLRPLPGLVSPAGLAALRPAPAEVAEVFTVPVEFFRTTLPQPCAYDLIPRVPESFPYEAVGIPRDYPWNCGKVEVPVWLYGGHAIWGMTARIVRDLVSHL